MSDLTKLTTFFSEDLVPYFNARNKKPILTQITEMTSLYRKYQSLPYQYIKSRLYKRGVAEDVINFIPPKLIANLQDRLNDKNKLRFAYDKQIFREFLERKGLPVVREIFRIFPSGVIHDSNQNEITRAVAEQMLAAHGENVFVKPTTGSFGVGAFIHDILQPTDQLFVYSVDRLIQPIITQHETLKALHPLSVNTIRIDTLLYDGQCFNNAAVLKMGVGGMIVDNLRAGSLVAGIDMKTGRLFPTARQRAISSQEEYERHPDTGVAFASVTIPFWKDVIDLTSKAAEALPQLRTLGWDVAITPTGPLLIEANINWGVNLMQDGWGGMGATRIGRLALELRGSHD